VVLMWGGLGDVHLDWKNARKRDRTWCAGFHRECLCGIGAPVVLVWDCWEVKVGVWLCVLDGA
jgi:hypothetical protein